MKSRIGKKVSQMQRRFIYSHCGHLGLRLATPLPRVSFLSSRSAVAAAFESSMIGITLFLFSFSRTSSL